MKSPISYNTRTAQHDFFKLESRGIPGLYETLGIYQLASGDELSAPMVIFVLRGHHKIVARDLSSGEIRQGEFKIDELAELIPVLTKDLTSTQRLELKRLRRQGPGAIRPADIKEGPGYTPGGVGYSFYGRDLRTDPSGRPTWSPSA